MAEMAEFTRWRTYIADINLLLCIMCEVIMHIGIIAHGFENTELDAGVCATLNDSVQLWCVDHPVFKAVAVCGWEGLGVAGVGSLGALYDLYELVGGCSPMGTEPDSSLPLFLPEAKILRMAIGGEFFKEL